MLNCTDLACVLHHHHFYAHLHQLKHHLQDDVDNTGLGNGSNVDNNDNTQSIINETDSDLSSLSHVDDPNNLIYTICGVVIAMLLVAVIIILVAVTINKLRKREDSATAVTPPTIVEPPHNRSSSINTAAALTSSQNNNNQHILHHHVDQQLRKEDNSAASECQYAITSIQTTAVISKNANNNCNNSNSTSCSVEHVTFSRTSGVGATKAATTSVAVLDGCGCGSGDSSDWIFPPKAPTPNIYNCMTTDMLLATSEKNGFKGFRKQFSGRFKRLVVKKPDPPPAIPPELKSQLKTIYVY